MGMCTDIPSYRGYRYPQGYRQLERFEGKSVLVVTSNLLNTGSLISDCDLKIRPLNLKSTVPAK